MCIVASMAVGDVRQVPSVICRTDWTLALARNVNLLHPVGVSIDLIEPWPFAPWRRRATWWKRATREGDRCGGGAQPQPAGNTPPPDNHPRLAARQRRHGQRFQNAARVWPCFALIDECTGAKAATIMSSVSVGFIFRSSHWQMNATPHQVACAMLYAAISAAVETTSRYAHGRRGLVRILLVKEIGMHGQTFRSGNSATAAMTR